jgi:hypothetical protein
LRSGPGLLLAPLFVTHATWAHHATVGSVSEHTPLARTTCGYVVLMVALLVTIGLTDGAAQPSATYCDAAYCYVQTCERRPAPTPACRYVTERVCRPVAKQECTTRTVQWCHTVTDQACQYRSVNECKSVNKYVCKPAYKRVAEAQEGATEEAQQVQSLQKPVVRKVMRPLRTIRRYHPHRQAAPQQQQKPNKWVGRPHRPYPPYQKPDRTGDRGSVARGSKAPGASKPHGSSQPAAPQQQCSWQMQNVCGPVAKQECRPVSKQVCNDYPEQSCYPRQVQDCHAERRQVCDPAQPPQEHCWRRQVQRDCTAPQYWTPQGCVSPPRPTFVPPPTEYSQQPSKGGGGKPPTTYVKPDDQKGTDTAKLDPLLDELQKTPDPPPPNKVEAPPQPGPPEPRRENIAPPSPAPRGTTVDVSLNGRTWRVELDPVPIATGAGLALLLGLLALWPKRKDVPTDADQLARLGIECRVEPDLGEQAVTHLERPPVGPRITVRATPGSRRHGIVMR